jgi:hypothetical protein
MDLTLTIICVAVLIWIGLGRRATGRGNRVTRATPEDLRYLIHAASTWRRSAR